MSEIVKSALGRFRRVADADKKWWLWECPVCKRWGGLSEQQWEGKVSVDHSKMHADCTYHETHEFGQQLVSAVRANILMGGPPAIEDKP